VSCADLLRDAKRRGMPAPLLAFGWRGRILIRGAKFCSTPDGSAAGSTRANVLGALHKSAHPAREEGPGRDLASRGQRPRNGRSEGFRGRPRAKFPIAAAKITGYPDQLLAFYDYPAEHWMVHLRITNPVESTFAASSRPPSARCPFHCSSLSRSRCVASVDITLKRRDACSSSAAALCGALATIGLMTGVAGAARLLERDGELADLVGLVARSQVGRGAAAVIVGPPGIGKTALLDPLHGHAARRGVRSLRARGSRRRAERGARGALA
jgi:hypothetical protein